MVSVWLRRLAIFGAPLGLAVLAAIHPLVGGALVPEDKLGVWTLIHTLQIPLAALLGVAVVLMLDRVDGVEARVARLAVIPWVAAFAAFDGIAGLATGALSEYGHLHPAQSTVVLGIAAAITDSPIAAAALPLGALFFGLVAFGGAAVALQRAGASGIGAVAIGAGGVVWTFIHPLIGAPAMLVFAFGAFLVERWAIERGLTHPNGARPNDRQATFQLNIKESI
jgi:hypothetical protein